MARPIAFGTARTISAITKWVLIRLGLCYALENEVSILSTVSVRHVEIVGQLRAWDARRRGGRGHPSHSQGSAGRCRVVARRRVQLGRSRRGSQIPRLRTSLVGRARPGSLRGRTLRNRHAWSSSRDRRCRRLRRCRRAGREGERPARQSVAGRRGGHLRGIPYDDLHGATVADRIAGRRVRPEREAGEAATGAA